MKNNITKKQYIQKSYDVLSSEGLEAVSIRRLGKELYCNTANLYRYFRGLDELIIYSSLRYLSGYLNEVLEYSNSIEDNLELHFAVWDCFAKYSFSNPEIFNNIFFGKYSNELDYIIKDYYTIFQEDIKGMNVDLQNVFINGDFDYRDYLMIAKCIEDGRFSEEDGKFLNNISIHLYKGFLKDLLDKKSSERNPDDTKEKFIDCLKKIIYKYAA